MNALSRSKNLKSLQLVGSMAPSLKEIFENTKLEKLSLLIESVEDILSNNFFTGRFQELAFFAHCKNVYQNNFLFS